MPRELSRALARSRLGLLGVYHWPLAPPTWEQVGPGRTDATTETWHTMCAPRCCPVCRAQRAEVGLAPLPLCFYHILGECPHPAVASVRASLLADLPRFVAALACMCRRAQHRATAPLGAPRDPPDLPTLRSVINTATQQQDWGSPLGLFLIHRLLTVATWPARVVALEDRASLADLLGQLFDGTNVANQFLRSLAYNWAAWAGTRLLKITRAWGQLANTHPPFEEPPPQ